MKGFSLLELMISLLLFMLLMMILMQQILHLRRMSTELFLGVDETLEMQWVTDFIRSRVRMVGYTPCRRIDHLEVFDARVNPNSLAMMTFHGEKLTLRRMHEQSFPILKQKNDQVFFTRHNQLSRKWPVMVADCYHAEVHDISTINSYSDADEVILSMPLQFTYEPPVYVGEWISESFFTRNVSFGKYALFYKNHHVDKLTSSIQKISMNLHEIQDYLYVHLVLEGHAQSWILKTRVRAL
jgi:hypothetical protein